MNLLAHRLPARDDLSFGAGSVRSDEAISVISLSNRSRAGQSGALTLAKPWTVVTAYDLHVRVADSASARCRIARM